MDVIQAAVAFIQGKFFLVDKVSPLVAEDADGVVRPVRVSADGAISTAGAAPEPVTAWTNRSGSITTGGASQTLAAANTARKYLFIQNISTENLWFNETTAAAANAASVRLAPGESYESPAHAVPRGAITIVGATTGSKFVAKEG